MGTDCTVVIEANDKYINADFWEPISVLHSPRCYDFFDILQSRGTPGYPEGVNWLTKEILEKYECWGEKYMSYGEYLDCLEKADLMGCKLMYPIKKSIVRNYEMRVVFRFDN